MSEYLAPGVFVEEVSFQPSQIQPASTSVAGMVGPSRFGPYGVAPQLLTSFNDFLTYFGDAEDLVVQTAANQAPSLTCTNHCAYAAQVFFDNGGQQLYFARIYNNVANGPGAAVPSPQTASIAVPATTSWLVTLKAQFPGTGGNLDVIFQARRSPPLLQYAAPKATDTVILKVSNPPTNALTGLSLPAGVTQIQSLTAVATLTAATPGSPLVPPSSGSPGAPPVPATPAQYTFVPGQPVIIVDQSGQTHVSTTVATGILQSAVPQTGAGAPQAVSLQVLPGIGATPVYSIPVGPNLRSQFGVPAGVTTLYATVSGANFTASAALNPGASSMSPITNAPLASLAMGSRIGDGNIYYDCYDILVQRSGTTLYSVTGVHLDSAALANNMSLALPSNPTGAAAATQPIFATYNGTVTGSALWPALLAAFDSTLLNPTTPGVVPSFVLHLVNGTDGGLPLPADYSGADASNFGLSALESIDEVSIVICPAAAADPTNHQAVVASMIAHCTKMLYRVAVIDSPKGAAIADVQTFRSFFSDTRTALYYPWVSVASLGAAGGNVLLPPSGFVAGLYAYTDIMRGVFKAPANVVIQDALGLETAINTAQQEVLNPLGINCLREFTWGGFRVWGARTLSSDPQWQYVNVRRYFLYLEHSLASSTSWVVFEPNGQALWSAVATTVSDFLYNEWREGHLFGATAAEAFFVRCDMTTMTQADLDDGRLICVIGVAPLEPAEFVIFRIGQYTANSSS